MNILNDCVYINFRDIKMEEEQRLMQKAASDTLNDIDKKCLRALQVIIFIFFHFVV